jgi:hypothetical protein
VAFAVGDEDAGNACGGCKLLRDFDADDDHGLRKRLTGPRVSGKHRHGNEIALAWCTRERVDEVMDTATALDPRSHLRGAGDESAAGNAEGGQESSVIERIGDGEIPPVTGRADAIDPNVTAKVDTGSTCTEADHFGHDQIGGQAFADTTEIETDPDRNHHRAQAGIEHNADTSHAWLQCSDRRQSGHLREGAVVTESVHRGKHRRVESSPCQPPCLNSSRDEQKRVGGNSNRATGPAVDPVEIAVSHKAAPASFQLGQTSLCDMDEITVAANNDHVRFGSHGREPKLGDRAIGHAATAAEVLVDTLPGVAVADAVNVEPAGAEIKLPLETVTIEDAPAATTPVQVYVAEGAGNSK